MSANLKHSEADPVLEVEADDPSLAAPVAVPVGPSPAELADRAFVSALRRVSLLRDLHEGELSRLLARMTAKNEFARQLDLLELYYSSGDEVARMRRIETDRFVIHHASSGENAHAVVRRLATVLPTLGRPSLERSDGGLVLRTGEHVYFVTEDGAEPGAGAPGKAHDVSVRALVRAANGLLRQLDVSSRWVLFRCDGRREAFCAVDADRAMELCSQGLLEERSATRLLEFCAS